MRFRNFGDRRFEVREYLQQLRLLLGRNMIGCVNC